MLPEPFHRTPLLLEHFLHLGSIGQSESPRRGVIFRVDRLACLFFSEVPRTTPNNLRHFSVKKCKKRCTVALLILQGMEWV